MLHRHSKSHTLLSLTHETQIPRSRTGFIVGFSLLSETTTIVATTNTRLSHYQYPSTPSSLTVHRLSIINVVHGAFGYAAPTPKLDKYHVTNPRIYSSLFSFVLRALHLARWSGPFKWRIQGKTIGRKRWIQHNAISIHTSLITLPSTEAQ